MSSRREVEGPKSPKAINVMIEVTGIWTNLGQYEPSRILLEEALESSRVVLDEIHPNSSRAKVRLASVWRNQGPYDDAEAAVGRAHEISKAMHGERSPVTHDVYEEFGEDVSYAETIWRGGNTSSQACSALSPGPGHPHQHTLVSITHLADNQYEQGHYGEAEKLQSKVLRVFKQIHGLDVRTHCGRRDVWLQPFISRLGMKRLQNSKYNAAH